MRRVSLVVNFQSERCTFVELLNVQFGIFSFYQDSFLYFCSVITGTVSKNVEIVNLVVPSFSKALLTGVQMFTDSTNFSI